MLSVRRLMILLRQGVHLASVRGGHGLLLAIVSLALYALGQLALDVDTMMAVVLGQRLWYGLYGTWLIRTRTPTT